MTNTRRTELRFLANGLLGSAVLGYAVTLALGAQSAVGSMLLVLVALTLHIVAGVSS